MLPLKHMQRLRCTQGPKPTLRLRSTQLPHRVPRPRPMQLQSRGEKSRKENSSTNRIFFRD
jgi:hypothetical protein